MWKKPAIRLGLLLLTVSLLTACAATPDRKDGAELADPLPAEDVQMDADVQDAPAENPSAEAEPKPEPEPELEPEPEPEPDLVDPNSVWIPDFSDFFLLKKRFNQGYGDVGWRYQLGPIPDAAREDVVREVFELVEDPRYQLELDFVDDNYYEDGSGEVHEYYYRYTGTNPAITDVSYEFRKYPFQFVLSVYDTSYKDGLFSLSFYYNENFEEEILGRYTCRRTDKDSDGGLREPDEFPQTGQAGSGGSVPDSSGIYDHTPPASRLDCLTCKGDGDCNTCGGDGYRSIGGAKAGCRTCHGNGKCRSCGGSGKR